MNQKTRQEILDLVHARPRSIAEIAEGIEKNWRTADKYVAELVEEDMLGIHIFRKGGRGAIKVVYWPTSLQDTPSAVKNYLFDRIKSTSRKWDFSPLDIVQHVDKKKRELLYLSEGFYQSGENLTGYLNELNKAKETILLFSGNLSFIDLTQKQSQFYEALVALLEKGVNINILTRADASNKQRIRDLLALNEQGKKGRLTIRYAHQPLRCTIIDDKSIHLRESFAIYEDLTKKSQGEYIYRITDESWTKWLTDVFWHLWRGSLEAEERIKILEEVIRLE